MDRSNKRARQWDDDPAVCQQSPCETAYYTAGDVAAAIRVPLLRDEILLRVVLPTLRGAQKRDGFVPSKTLSQALANVLTDGVSSALLFSLHQWQIDHLIFAAELQHEQPEHARLFCSGLSVDPWNTLSPISGCAYGNFNQVPPSLNDAVRFFKGKSWDIRTARNMALSALGHHNASNLMNFSPQRAQRHRPQQRRLF